MGINGWYEGDTETLLHCKELGNGKYALIQMTWLDTCGDDTRAENAVSEADNYCVCADVVDLNDYPDEVKDMYLEAAFNYQEILEDIINEYSPDELMEIIAESIFVEDRQTDRTCISGVVSRADAEEIIRKYLEKH